VRGDPVATRTRHWTRWRRRQLRDMWRRASHVDVLGEEGRTTWICSWQRSGSTLLAEVLATPRGTRLIYEPANLPQRIVTGEAAALTALPTGPGDELAAVERALRGRVRGAWVDQLCDCHAVQRRVVKDVRAIGLLDLVSARHPRVPIIVLVRHPLSIALSAVALGWTDPQVGRALVIAYEHLVTDPDVTLDRVTAHLATHHRTWQDLAIDRRRLDAPSSTSFRRTTPRTANEWIGTFETVERGVLDETVRMLDAAGLGGLYGESPEPLVGPDALGRTPSLR
jgi:hypothetical protein